MLPAYRKALRKLYTADVNKLLLELREYRKRINRFLMANEKSATLRAHRDRTLTESTLATCRMDGIDVSEPRLLELAETEPTNDKERQAMGVRFAISTVEDSFRFVRISTGAISQLHRDLFRYSENPDGGRWADSEAPDFFASELDRMTARRFGGTLATKRALLRDACNNYRSAVISREFDPIVEACMFMLDVINIQPFTSGNGRLARLLFQLMAYQNGYMAIRYESLNARLENLGSRFEETVAACPRVTPEGESEYDAETDYEPFVVMMLEALLDCCKSFGGKYDLDAVKMQEAEEPEEVEVEPRSEKKTARRSLQDVSLEERLAMRAAMQATAREILQQPVSPAFSSNALKPKNDLLERYSKPSATESKNGASAPSETAREQKPETQPEETVQAAKPDTPEAAEPAVPYVAAESAAADLAAEEPAKPESVSAGNAAEPDNEQERENAVQAPVPAVSAEPEASAAAAIQYASEQSPDHLASNEEVVRNFFDKLEGDASKKDVVAACPSMSAKTVERMIQKLLAEGYIVKLGAARATTYRKA